MEFIRTDLDGIILIKPDVHADERGFLLKAIHGPVSLKKGITVTFVQDNHSRSASKGVVRGLHFQVPPFAQNKLVRVTRGAIWDVVVI